MKNSAKAIFMLFSLLALSGVANAALSVTAATGGGAIASNTTAGCSAAGWTALTGPVLTESNGGQINTGTIILSAPAGFQFNTASTVTVKLTGGSGTNTNNINDAANNSSMSITSITTTAITFTVTFKSASKNTLTWQGIQVQPTASASTSGNIIASGTSNITGNIGALNEVLSVPACNLTVLAEYRFDEVSASTVTDSSSNNLSGTLNGGVTVGGSGRICNGYNFNGSNAFVSVPNTTLLNPTQITVAAWVRHTAATIKSWEAIVAKGDSAYRLHLLGATGCSINSNNTLGALSFAVNGGCAGADVSSGMVPLAGTWYHVVGTYDGATIKIYVDSALKGSAAYAGTIASNTYPLNIGENAQQPAGRYWSGDIDEVKIYGVALSAAQISAGYTNESSGKNWDGTARVCLISGPDHIEIDHSGSALTCSPQIVTIKACADGLNPCTLYTAGGVTVTLTPGGQTFAIGASGINSAATVQQSTTGIANLAATSTPTTLNATTCLNTVTGTASCAMTFNNSGFLVTVPNHTSCSNATATIEAVQTAPGTGRCVPAYQSVTRAVNLYSSYVSPATGTQVVTASTGAVSTSAPGTAHSLAFDATGKATITLSYPDAGQLTLTATDTAPTGAAMTGSGTFIAAPALFAFSGIPAAPLTAGSAFNATVTAMNACATPAMTANFAGTATITSGNPLPGIGNATAINTPLTVTAGTGSANPTWNEVGTITLNANLANYLGSGLSVAGIQTGVGRFQPAYFDTVVTPGCSTFTYAGSITPFKPGQPFTTTVTAKAAGGIVTTANYAGAYAYLTTLSNAGATAGFASNTIAAVGFANGVGSANVITYAVATPQTAPLTLAMRATDADPTPVSSSGHAEGAAAIRSGRAKLGNAYGSELLGLPVPFRAEYWNNGWVFNSADSCSGDVSLGAGNAVSVTLSSPPVTCVQDSGNPGLSGSGCAAAGPTAQKFKEGATPGIGFSGDFNLWLRAPGAGNTGAVTVTGNVPVWLQHPWGGGLAINPTARATFGVYQGRKEFIYMRENY